MFFSLQRYFVRGPHRRLGEGLSRDASTAPLAPPGIEPLSPQRKWRAITLATLLLAPAFWSLLAGLVAVAADDGDDGRAAGAAIAFGLALIPFVFIVLAFLSEHPTAPGAVAAGHGARACSSGIPVSALAGDAVTGIVAGVGAGGIVALRADDGARLAAARRRGRRRRRLHVRARPDAGRGRAARRAGLPVHRPRPRRPLVGVAPRADGASGRARRPATG